MAKNITNYADQLPLEDLFFVLNGYVNGNDGEYAIRAGSQVVAGQEVRRMEDGWYYLLPDSPFETDGKGPFDSKQEAIDDYKFNVVEYREVAELLNYEGWDMKDELINNRPLPWVLQQPKKNGEEFDQLFLLTKTTMEPNGSWTLRLRLDNLSGEKSETVSTYEFRSRKMPEVFK